MRWRTFLRRGYKQDRVKKRQIFLQSYELATIDSALGGSKISCKLKRVMIKVK